MLYLTDPFSRHAVGQHHARSSRPLGKTQKSSFIMDVTLRPYPPELNVRWIFFWFKVQLKILF